MTATTTRPASVLAQGRPVMRAHPELSTAAAELLHTLDALEDDDRLKARAYLLHVYGIALGCHPSTRRLEDLDTWAEDRNALAAASGHLFALSQILEGSVRDEEAAEDGRLIDLTEAHASQLLIVAHRG